MLRNVLISDLSIRPSLFLRKVSNGLKKGLYRLTCRYFALKLGPTKVKRLTAPLVFWSVLKKVDRSVFYYEGFIMNKKNFMLTGILTSTLLLSGPVVGCECACEKMEIAENQECISLQDLLNQCAFAQKQGLLSEQLSAEFATLKDLIEKYEKIDLLLAIDPEAVQESIELEELHNQLIAWINELSDEGNVENEENDEVIE